MFRLLRPTATMAHAGGGIHARRPGSRSFAVEFATAPQRRRRSGRWKVAPVGPASRQASLGVASVSQVGVRVRSFSSVSRLLGDAAPVGIVALHRR